MEKYKQDPPFAIQLEPTEGCNLYCDFCGLQGIRSKAGENYKFMTPSTAQTIADDIRAERWTSRIEFAMHGEPTLNPNLVEIVDIFRRTLPKNQLMVTSNGGGLLADPSKVWRLFDAGLNILALDKYERVLIVDKLLAKLRTAPQTPAIPIIHYPQDGLNNSPHHRWPKGTQVIIVVQDILEAQAGGHATLTNHCGSGAPLNNKAEGKRCAKPFRELAVRWDGTVAGCCNDWRGVYKVGNVKEQVTLGQLWQNAAFTAMRRKLYYGERDFGACKGCDATSYRVGLLPDKLGKVVLPKATEDDYVAIKQATRGRPLTVPVKVRWEK